MPKAPDDDIIRIEELTKIIYRRADTIRKWEYSNTLPKRLHGKRREGDIRRRYWTHDQVYGPKGIIAWMKKNNMRPGNLLVHPDDTDGHIHNLRRPKYMNGDVMHGIKMMVNNGKSREYILKKVLPKTKYVSELSLERALVKTCKEHNIPLPPRKRDKKK